MAIQRGVVDTAGAPEYSWEPLLQFPRTKPARLSAARRFGLWHSPDWASWALVAAVAFWCLALYEVMRPETIR